MKLAYKKTGSLRRAGRCGLLLALLLVSMPVPAVARIELLQGSADNAGEFHAGLRGSEVARLRFRAEKGDADALFQLGNIYYAPPDGSGVRQNYRMAFEAFWAAAQRGHATAQHNVGAMYMNGDYVAADPIEGYAWFRLSQSNGDPAGARRCEQFASKLNAEQREQAELRHRALSDYFLKPVAQRGNLPLPK